MLTQYANPTRFLQLADRLQPWCNVACATLFAAGLYLAFLASPPDYQQGITVRIMYVHVPAAWMALFIYSTMAISSFVFLVWKHAMADIWARASCSIGLWMALLTLVTGSLWGKPMWGTWWEWDARMTSMLILFFLYVGYSLLARDADHDQGQQKTCAVMALIGAINIPIIKFSVDWWNTLHQGASVFRLDGPTIAAPMLWPLLIMALAFTFFYICVVFYQIRIIVARARILRLKSRQLAE